MLQKESPEEFVKPPPDPVLVEKVKNAGRVFVYLIALLNF